MNSTFRIAVVEDNAPQRMIMSRLLESNYHVQLFENGLDFLTDNGKFDAVLLDIEMPELNGYETCRRFRQQKEGVDTPVIFVSAHDAAEERVAAYEAGGDDFVIKPIAADELRHKLSSSIAHRELVRELTSQSSNAQHIALTAMTSMGDLGVIIDFQRKTGLATSYAAVAARLIAAMKTWGLQGAVQVRGRQKAVNLTAEGPMSALQASVLEKMRSMGRIFELGSRAVINYEHVSLLIENLPVDDADKVGRLRDHLTLLAESADMRMSALDAATEHEEQKQATESALAELRRAVGQISTRLRTGHAKSQHMLLESLDQLGRTLASLGLSESQISYLDDLIHGTTDEILAYFDEVAQDESEFDDVLSRLQWLTRVDYPS